MRASSPREKFVLSYNDFRVLAWQLDQQPAASDSAASSSTSSSVSSTASPVLSSCHELRPKGKRKLADRSIISFANHRERSKSPRKRVKTSSVESGSITQSDSDAERLCPALTPSSFAAAINLTSSAIPALKSSRQASARRGTPSIRTQSSEESSTSDNSSSRTSSPGKGCSQQNRVALEFTRPNFYSGLPEFESDDELEAGEDPERPRDGVDDKHDVPEFISALIRDFSESSVTPGCIPAELKSMIRKYSHGTEYIPGEAFGAIPYRVEPAPLFRSIRNIFTTAHRLYKSHKGDKAWFPLVRSILSGPLEIPQTTPLLGIDESQSKRICHDLLPLAGATRIPSVQTDYQLQLSRDHKHVAAVLNPLFVREPALSLSAFDDPVAAKCFSAALVDVAGPSGDFDQAAYRLAVASAAVLARLRLLARQAADDATAAMPLLGWVVHGHFWHLHLSYQQRDGSIRVLGPLPSGNTATYLGIFRLLQVVQRVKTWIESTYWPYLRGLVDGRHVIEGVCL